MLYSGHIASDIDGSALGALPVRVFSNRFTLTEQARWDSHSHPDLHELVWGCRGALTVDTDEGLFAVPASLGLWIPAGVTHRVRAAAGTTFTCTFISTDMAELPTTASRVHGMVVPPVVMALLDRLSQPPWLPDVSRLPAEDLALRLLEPKEFATVNLPMPTDSRAVRVARSLVADPADGRSAEDWGKAVGASSRTLHRLFVASTGLSFTEWRTRARMRRAIEDLAAGNPVSNVGRRIGYSTSSAFVQAFRREVGMTPGEFASLRKAAPATTVQGRTGTAFP